MEVGICKHCRAEFANDEEDAAFETEMCYECFENALEEFEEKRRKQIALKNEY